MSCQHSVSFEFDKTFFHAPNSIFLVTNYYFMAMTNPFLTTQSFLLRYTNSRASDSSSDSSSDLIMTIQKFDHTLTIQKTK